MAAVRVKEHERTISGGAPVTIPAVKVRRGFKSTLVYSIKGIPVRANIRLKRLSVEDFFETPRVVMKDKNGRFVRNVMVDAITGEEIGASSTGAKFRRVLMNDLNEVIPSTEVRYFQVLSGGGEMEIKKFESNIGLSKQLQVEAEIPEVEAERYLYESVYELVGETASDDEVLFTIAKSLTHENKALIVTVVFRKGFKKSWGIIFAEIGADTFIMNMRVSRTKLQAISPMKIPTETFVKIKKELPTLVWVRK